jgi:hypothetical protein
MSADDIEYHGRFHSNVVAVSDLPLSRRVRARSPVGLSSQISTAGHFASHKAGCF